MPDADGRIRGISVGNVPWHSSTADATLGSSLAENGDKPPEPEETLDFMDPVQEVAAVLIGRNVMRVSRSYDGILIETSDAQVFIRSDSELEMHVDAAE